MVELFGFLPYMLLFLRTARLKLYRALPIVILAALLIVFYSPQTILTLRLFLALAGFNINNSGLSQPGRFTLLGNFPQLSIASQFKPLLVSEAVVLGAAIFDIYRQRMSIERLVLYIAFSSVFVLLFSNLIALWFWVIPICLLYAIMKEKNDLGAFMLVFGTSVAFLEVVYAFGPAYLIIGTFEPIVLGIEGIQNARKILSIMVTSLSMILLFLLKIGKGQADQTMLRTSGLAISIYLLLYFWLEVYPP
jgi:hypothetical protein